MVLPSAIFAVEDVCYQIISNLEPELYHEARLPLLRKTLVQAARTCRSFRRPALRTLWKRLPDDRPLVDLLYTLGIVSVERNGTTITTHEGEVEDWEGYVSPICPIASQSTAKI